MLTHDAQITTSSTYFIIRKQSGNEIILDASKKKDSSWSYTAQPFALKKKLQTWFFLLPPFNDEWAFQKQETLYSSAKKKKKTLQNWLLPSLDISTKIKKKDETAFSTIFFLVLSFLLLPSDKKKKRNYNSSCSLGSLF